MEQNNLPTFKEDEKKFRLRKSGENLIKDFKNGKVKFTTSIYPEIYLLLAKASELTGRSVSGIINDILKEQLQSIIDNPDDYRTYLHSLSEYKRTAKRLEKMLARPIKREIMNG